MRRGEGGGGGVTRNRCKSNIYTTSVQKWLYDQDYLMELGLKNPQIEGKMGLNAHTQTHTHSIV